MTLRRYTKPSCATARRAHTWAYVSQERQYRRGRWTGVIVETQRCSNCDRMRTIDADTFRQLSFD